MQQGFKPFPPFGALLHQLQSANIKLNYCPYIFCGKDAMNEARIMNGSGQITLCLPPQTEISDYLWPVRGLSLILFDTGDSLESDLDKAVLALLAEGATQVCLYRLDLPGVEIYN